MRNLNTNFLLQLKAEAIFGLEASVQAQCEFHTKLPEIANNAENRKLAKVVPPKLHDSLMSRRAFCGPEDTLSVDK